MSDTPEIIGFGGPGVAGARVLGGTWEDEPAAPQPSAGAEQATDGAEPRQEEST